MDTYHQLQSIREDTLLLFVTYLTIQVYLSAVRHNQLTTDKYSIGLQQPKVTLCTERHTEVICHHLSTQGRLPITFPIMIGLQAVFLKTSGNFRDIMISAACCLAYFGLLSVSKFIVSSSDFFDPLKDLRCCLGQPSTSVTHTRQYKAI